MPFAKAAVMTEINKPFTIKNYELTPPEKGFAMLKLAASGVCGTDIHIHKGKIPVPLPLILGHEFIGKVEALSDEDIKKYNIKIGDSAMVYVACPCGECALCKCGDDANCLNMGVTYVNSPENAPHFYGGYGEYNYSPVKNLIKIPDSLEPVMTGVFACAGPTVLHAFGLAEKAGCLLGDAGTAVVQGLGPIGLFAVIYFKSLGVKNIITVTARQNEKRSALAKELGATNVLSFEGASSQDITKQICEISGGAGADVVLEASGNPQAFAQGLDMLRNRGVYLVPGQYSNSGAVGIEPQIITFKALHIIGSSQYSESDIHLYLDFLLKNPKLYGNIKKLAKCYTIEDANTALEDATAGKNIKTMFTL